MLQSVDQCLETHDYAVGRLQCTHVEYKNGSLRAVRAISMSLALKIVSPLSAGHQIVPKLEGYLNRSFPGVKKRGIKGEVKRGEVVGE